MHLRASSDELAQSRHFSLITAIGDIGS